MARGETKRYPSQGHPWADFLHHRARALEWLRLTMGNSSAQSAAVMRMDPLQVALILATVAENPGDYPAGDVSDEAEAQGKPAGKRGRRA